MRRLYREALDLHANGRGAEPPNPFDAGGEERFLEWLGEPVAIGLLPTLSRYLHAIYQDRIDLQRAFPDLVGADGPRYLEWIRADGVVQAEIPTSLLSPAGAEADDGLHAYVAASRLSEGVNIAGYFRAELGVGEAARLLTSAIEAATIPHATVTYDATPSRKAHPFAERGDRRAPYDVNILCVNADQTPTFAKRRARVFSRAATRSATGSGSSIGCRRRCIRRSTTSTKCGLPPGSWRAASKRSVGDPCIRFRCRCRYLAARRR